MAVMKRFVSRRPQLNLNHPWRRGIFFNLRSEGRGFATPAGNQGATPAAKPTPRTLTSLVEGSLHRSIGKVVGERPECRTEFLSAFAAAPVRVRQSCCKTDHRRASAADDRLFSRAQEGA